MTCFFSGLASIRVLSVVPSHEYLAPRSPSTTVGLDAVESAGTVTRLLELTGSWRAMILLFGSDGLARIGVHLLGSVGGLEPDAPALCSGGMLWSSSKAPLAVGLPGTIPVGFQR